MGSLNHCLCVCLCVCVFVCVYACVCVYVSIFVCVSVGHCVCVSWVCVCACLSQYFYLCVCVGLCTHSFLGAKKNRAVVQRPTLFRGVVGARSNDVHLWISLRCRSLGLAGHGLWIPWVTACNPSYRLQFYLLTESFKLTSSQLLGCKCQKRKMGV